MNAMGSLIWATTRTRIFSPRRHEDTKKVIQIRVLSQLASPRHAKKQTPIERIISLFSFVLFVPSWFYEFPGPGGNRMHPRLPRCSIAVKLHQWRKKDRRAAALDQVSL